MVEPLGNRGFRGFAGRDEPAAGRMRRHAERREGQDDQEAVGCQYPLGLASVACPALSVGDCTTVRN